MNIWVVHYSRTGTSARLADVVADVLANAGHRVARSAVAARPELPYLLWLAASFLPHMTYPISVRPPTLAPLDGCALISPKWTLNCPPVTGFLKRWCRRLPATTPLVTCGGWDQERYLRSLERRIERLGIPLLPGLWVRRDAVEADTSVKALNALVQRHWGPGVRHGLAPGNAIPRN